MTDKYRRLRDRVRSALSYWIGLARMEFTADLDRLMQEDEVSRAELARRIETSQAYITKVLGGTGNFTLETMAKLAQAMDAVLHIRLAREGELVKVEQPQTETTAVDLENVYESGFLQGSYARLSSVVYSNAISEPPDVRLAEGPPRAETVMLFDFSDQQASGPPN